MVNTIMHCLPLILKISYFTITVSELALQNKVRFFARGVHVECKFDNSLSSLIASRVKSEQFDTVDIQRSNRKQVKPWYYYIRLEKLIESACSN